MFVCICNRVTDTDIENEIYQGACSFEDIRQRLSVATCCGRCENCARDVISTTLSRQQSAPIMVPLPAIA